MKGFIAGVCKAGQRVHTRMGECAMFEGTPLGFIIHNRNTSFSLDEATFNTEIKAGIVAIGIDRVTPLLNGLTDFQVSGGDVQTSQEGFGKELPVKNNTKRVDYIINEGGICLFRQLIKFNGRSVRIIPVDKNRVAYGTVANLGGTDKFRGFAATLWSTRRDNTGTQAGAIIFSVFYDAEYENEEADMAAIALTETYEGLTGVILKRTGTGTAKFVIACSGDDLTSTYGTTLEDPTIYRNPAGGNPTTVVLNPTSDFLTFTPAAASYTILDAVTLKTAGIEGYEGEEEYVDLT